MTDVANLMLAVEPQIDDRSTSWIGYPHGVPVEVCNLFEELALQVAATGRSHYSSDAVLHRIRWHFQIDCGKREYRLNDHWTAPLARWFLRRHPDLPKFFELRERRLTGDERNAA